jgi:hypothetical protein
MLNRIQVRSKCDRRAKGDRRFALLRIRRVHVSYFYIINKWLEDSEGRESRYLLKYILQGK